MLQINATDINHLLKILNTISPLQYKSSSCELSDVNVRLHVQLCKLVHMSGIHCYVLACSTSGWDFVYCTIQHGYYAKKEQANEKMM